MAPRANWKGFLRLSLVTCPIALFPATSESDKISFNQINKKNRQPDPLFEGRCRHRRGSCL
jgi:non-homologous end joining protein Ku